MTWLLLSLAGFLGFGIQNFLYKVSAKKQLHSRTVTFYFIVLSTVVLWIAFFSSKTSLNFSRTVIILAVLDAILFYTTTLTRIEALKFIPTHLAFPLMRTSTLLVSLSGVVFFNEPWGIALLLAIGLLILAAYLISADRKNDRAVSLNYRLGLGLTIVALITSTGTNIVSKLAAEHTAILDYMTLANTLIIVLSLAEVKIFTNEKIGLPDKTEFLISLGLAVSNLIAWYAYLLALRIGPLSTTAVIVGMGFIVPIILAAIVYHERLSTKRILAVLCTMLSIILVKLS